tara:strand:- start:4979 stop:5836 length:858 start_codon:yes stop_codon:yes gene_type:complete
MSGIEGWYEDNPNVAIITNLDDISLPRDCNAWGEQHEIYGSTPLITDDGSQDVLWGWFNTGLAFPSTVYIDHTMTVYFKANNPSPTVAISTIDAMLGACGQQCVLSPPTALYDYTIDGNTVTFFDLSSLINEGWTVESWMWNFGDGNVSDSQNPIHTYSSDGSYEVSLQITTTTGLESDLYIDNIIIGTLNSEGYELPDEIIIHQNYPNPFNPSTSINFDLPFSDVVKIQIYDIFGNHIADLKNEYMVKGNHKINWSPENLSSGIYIVNISQKNMNQLSKMIYIK